MHRSYQPIKPTHNKLLQRKWDDNNYEEHRRKVIEARPTVDTRPPQTYMHLHLKLKKLQMEEDRLATIERDNRILLEKMSNIMKTKGRIDNQNNYEYKSLNREKRVRELLKVTRENQDILKRITSKKPQYDHNEWEKDWETNQQYMDQISAYRNDSSKKENDASRETARSSNGRGGRRQQNDEDYDDDYEDEFGESDDEDENHAKEKKTNKSKAEEKQKAKKKTEKQVDDGKVTDDEEIRDSDEDKKEDNKRDEDRKKKTLLKSN